MIIANTSVPVIVLNCKLGALGIMRSLGSLGIQMAGVDADPKSPAMLSKYCKKKFFMDLDLNKADEYLDFILKIKDELKQKAILIPTSDETSVFVAQYYKELSEFYITPQNSADLLSNLMNKDKMYHLALKYEVPTPHTEFPQSLLDVENYLRNPHFPAMLKAIDGNKLYARTLKKMVIVNNAEELLRNYQDLEDKKDPNLMIQELIPGTDDQVFIFNGYFDENSDCKVAFTGHKIRQFPIHVGCASLGINLWNEDVNKITTDFMKKLGYRGILDIGYRLDPTDGQYKVLDINPRIGQAFRIFTSHTGMDVVRALYLDLTKQKIEPSVSKNGRKWVIEDYDIISTNDYYWEKSLTFWQWLKSLKGIEEGAWFNWKDLSPFFWMCKQLLKQIRNKALKKKKTTQKFITSYSMGKKYLKKTLRVFLPLKIRKYLSKVITKLPWLNSDYKNWWATELIRDFADKDINEYHKFLWENHLYYAETYNIERRFGDQKIEKSRIQFFSDMVVNLQKIGVNTLSIKSVFEVGCSLGYQLYYLKNNIIPNVEESVGIDIDSYAICSGKEHLKRLNSKIKLNVANMVEIDYLLKGKMFDLVFCTGTLLYVNQVTAKYIVKKMLEHTNLMLCIAALADPEMDNSKLEVSIIRKSDMTFIHNVDEMILDAGGKIISREWQGDKLVDGLSVYFLFATKN